MSVPLRALPAGAVAAVVALTVALTQQPGQGAFSAATGTGGNQVTLLTTSGSGYLSWTVTQLVRDISSTSNNGFVVRDQTEGGAGAWQQFHSRLLASPPTLRVV